MKELEIFVKNIKNKQFLPIYFFCGEQEFFIDKAVELFENNLLTEEEKAFNQIIIYGKDSSFSEVVLHAQQFPMMGGLQVIIVKEAQNLDLKREEDKLKIERYINNPNPSTVLVFAHKHATLNKNSKLYKELNAHQFLFEFPKFKDYQIEPWISNYCKTQKIAVEAKVPELLAAYLGNNLRRIANELTKLKINLKEGEVIDEKMIETFVGISKDYNVFSLTEALKSKNETTAYNIVHFMAKNPNDNPMVFIVSQLFQFFNKTLLYHCLQNQNPNDIAKQLGINPFFIKDYRLSAQNYNLKNLTQIISAIRTADLQSKGLGVKLYNYKESLLELCYKIIHINEIK